MSDLLTALLDRCLTEGGLHIALASEQGQALAELVAAAEERTDYERHRLALWVAVANCGHPVEDDCPEVVALRADPQPLLAEDRLCRAIEALREAADAP